MENRVYIPKSGKAKVKLPMAGLDNAGKLYEVDNLSLIYDGKRMLPVTGEFQYSRYEPEGWEEELLKMKAGGVKIVATYVFWIHHEEKQGEWDFTGCRDLRAFLKLCQKLDMPVILRIGPWVHGECRHGGFPDWVQWAKDYEPRTNDAGYLDAVDKFFTRIGEEARGMMCKDGGPVFAVQLENEYGHCGGPDDAAVRKAHMAKLKELAIKAGFEVPYYTATGWGAASPDVSETLPMLGGYVDAPWATNDKEMPACQNFLFTKYRNDETIGLDWQQGKEKKEKEKFDITAAPFLTAELGGGIQVTTHRRPYVWADDTEANVLCTLGGGANLLGYYVYHGGINPEGKYTTLHEAQEIGGYTTLPTMNYDFQACIRGNGELHESFGRVKKFHYLVEDYEEMMAGAEVYLPEKKPSSAEDMETLRMTVRVNHEKKVGFLFLNNHQRKRTMKDHDDFSIGLVIDGKEREISGLALKSGECGVIPFDLPLEDTILQQTNAFLLGKLGRRTFFYTNLAEPKFVWEKESEWVTVLTKNQADRAFKVKDGLYIVENIDSCLIEQDGVMSLISKASEEVITIYREDGSVDHVTMKAQGVNVEAEAKLVKEDFDQEQKLNWREYKITLGDIPQKQINNLYLAVEYNGDRAEVYKDGKLLNDWFTIGETWHISLKRFGYPKELTIRVYPSDRLVPCTWTDGIYYDLSVEAGCEVVGVKTLPEYREKIEG